MPGNTYSLTPKVLRGITVLLNKPSVAAAMKEFKLTLDRQALKGIEQRDIDAVLSVMRWREAWTKSIETNGDET